MMPAGCVYNIYIPNLSPSSRSFLRLLPFLPMTWPATIWGTTTRLRVCQAGNAPLGTGGPTLSINSCSLVWMARHKFFTLSLGPQIQRLSSITSYLVRGWFRDSFKMLTCFFPKRSPIFADVYSTRVWSLGNSSSFGTTAIWSLINDLFPRLLFALFCFRYGIIVTTTRHQTS
jgi:hypothetical protein